MQAKLQFHRFPEAFPKMIRCAGSTGDVIRQALDKKRSARIQAAVYVFHTVFISRTGLRASPIVGSEIG
jgi:hypothetical protein